MCGERLRTAGGGGRPGTWKKSWRRLEEGQESLEEVSRKFSTLVKTFAEKSPGGLKKVREKFEKSRRKISTGREESLAEEAKKFWRRKKNFS